MKNPQLTSDTQNRLLAYTTAAGLGAFFSGQNVDAQVTESMVFAPYPHTLIPGAAGGGTGAYGFYHYFSIDGGTTQFDLDISDPLTSHPTVQFPSQVVDFVGYATGDSVLTPTFYPADLGGHTNNAYAACFLGGTVINATNASAPWYQPRLGLCYFAKNAYGGFYNYVDNKYITTGALGFEFIGSTDGQTHFGYMDVQVNTVLSNSIPVVASVVIKDVFYNATPNEGITVPIQVAISSIAIDTNNNNSITINFTSNDNADPSTFTLETSPTLGATANWTTDPSASIAEATTPLSGIPANGLDQTIYTAVTTAPSGASQFYRIKH